MMAYAKHNFRHLGVRQQYPLRIMGKGQDTHFQNYHRVLNRAVWSSLAAGQILLGLLISTFALRGPIVLGLDDTIERRCHS